MRDAVTLLYSWRDRVVPAVPPPAALWQRSRRTLAIHEASHIVVAELVGSPATGATVEQIIADAAGAAWSSTVPPARLADPLPMLVEPLFHRHRAQCFALAAVHFAGEQGEALAAGLATVDYFVTGSHDYLQGVAFLSLAFRNVTCGSVPRGGCQMFARDLLRHHWLAVEALADALLEHGTIGRPAIQAVVDRFGLVGLSSFDRPRDPRSIGSREARALRVLRVRPMRPARCPGCGAEFVPLRVFDRWCVQCDVQRRARGQSRRELLVYLAERVSAG